MKTRHISFTGSPEANESPGVNIKRSNYSTERSPRTALLFEATHTVVLPLVRLVGDLPSVEILPQTQPKVDCSIQE